MHLGLQNQVFEIVATDIEYLIILFEYFIKVFRFEPDPVDRVRIGSAMLAAVVRLHC